MEIEIWDIYYAQACAMFLHPGNKMTPSEAVETAKSVANHMMKLREERQCQD